MTKPWGGTSRVFPAREAHTIIQVCDPQPGLKNSSVSLTLPPTLGTRSIEKSIIMVWESQTILWRKAGEDNWGHQLSASINHQTYEWNEQAFRWVQPPDFGQSSWGFRHHWAETSHPHHVLSKLVTHEADRFWRNLLCSSSHWNTTNNKVIAKSNEHLSSINFTWFFEMFNTVNQSSIFKYCLYLVCIPLDGTHGTCIFLVTTY